MPINNPGALEFHNFWLHKFSLWLIDQDFKCEFTPEYIAKRRSWDWGVDIIVNNTVLDLKTFGLTEGWKSRSWASSFSKYRGNLPFYPGQLTEFFVHKVGEKFEDWLAAPATKLHKSYNGGPPFYWKDEVLTMGQLLNAIRKQTI